MPDLFKKMPSVSFGGYTGDEKRKKTSSHKNKRRSGSHGKKSSHKHNHANVNGNPKKQPN
eukprot:UN09681